jgi:zinc D-Ala-D-Ala dipeptidase
MNVEEKLLRSKSTERIDFSKYQSINVSEKLVKLDSTDNLLVEPCWTLENDWEGKRYREYINLHPEYDGIYVRSGLAKQLMSAVEHLEKKYKLVVQAGHRPIEVQRKLLIECADDYKNEHPGVSNVDALEHARIFVSDPEITLPPHVCGAAVDVEILNTETGKLLDFGSKINEDSERSFLHYSHLTHEQRSNRLMLLNLMLEADFASCMPEWWHFSYGDQVWAWFYGKQHSLYSPIDL